MMVKICGITNREDAVAAIEAGATALGFNFYPKSPRYVSPEAAAEIAEGLATLKVGVFVNEPNAASIAKSAGMEVLQLHGDEPPNSVPPAFRVWKAFKVTPEWDGAAIRAYRVEAVLLDGPAPGAGEAFDWKQAANVSGRIILAGGLDAENVSEAIRLVMPWGVDACSRLERAPGLKDHEKMRRFIRAAMETL